MKLKYYMRGLGIGMVVTAFILSVVLDKDTKAMSDEEVMARAKELGMVESTVLSQMAEQNKQDKTEIDESKPEQSRNPESAEPIESEPTEPETVETESVETESAESETAETETSETEPVEEEPSGTEEMVGTVTIVINPGESSESVSRSIESAGLIESAKKFDKYLCNNGYDNIIAVGKYEIPLDASEEEIAKIITRRK